MRFGIVSYNRYGNFTNYGSALQSWALKTAVNRLNKGPETLYGSPLKEPEHFYKFADTTRYNYPEDLPDTYSRPAQPEWPNY